jgi:hypothetical protein
LVELFAGNVKEGVDGYRKAEELAIKQHNQRVARLAALNLAFALRRVDPALLAAHQVDVARPVEIPSSMKDDPIIWQLTLRADLEGIAISWGDDDRAAADDDEVERGTGGNR